MEASHQIIMFITVQSNMWYEIIEFCQLLLFNCHILYDVKLMVFRAQKTAKIIIVQRFGLFIIRFYRYERWVASTLVSRQECYCTGWISDHVVILTLL